MYGHRGLCRTVGDRDPGRSTDRGSDKVGAVTQSVVNYQGKGPPRGSDLPEVVTGAAEAPTALASGSATRLSSTPDVTGYLLSLVDICRA